MASQAPTKPTKHETWRDWMPEGAPEPDRLFTREEVIARLAQRHVAGTEPIDAGDLQYWESIGVLPRPIRRRHEGAQRALYPDWYWLLARQVRMHQRAGLSLAEIRQAVRTYARLYLYYDTSSTANEIRQNNRLADSPEDIHLWPALVGELERLARWWHYLTDKPVDRVEVHIIGADGRATRYPLPIASHDGDTDNKSDLK